MALIDRLRRQRPDMALLLTNSLHTAVLAWLGGARQRVGYARDCRSWFLSKPVPAPREGRHFRAAPMVESYLALARAIGCPEESPELELHVTAAESQRAAQVWHDLGLRTDGRVVALNSSGAFGSAKLWPVEHCAALARQIVEKLDHDVLLLCGPGEREAARGIVARAGSPRVFSLAAQAVSLGLTKGCLARCRAMVSTDSGPRHMRGRLGQTGRHANGAHVAPMDRESHRPRANPRAELDCLGCGKRTCPLGHQRCMRKLTPQRVLTELTAVLRSTTIQAA